MRRDRGKAGARRRVSPRAPRGRKKSSGGSGGHSKVAAAAVGLLTGRIQGHPDGHGFLVPDDEDAGDIYLSRRALRPAMHGDRATVRVEHGARGRHREGQVIRVLERSARQLIGAYKAGVRTSSVVPRDTHIAYPVTVPAGGAGGARDGDLVVADITRYPTSYSDLECQVVSVLGPANDASVETDAIVAAYGIPADFPVAVHAEARRAAGRSVARRIGRRLDLRSLPIVTIDGSDARDFDDAVGIEVLDGGRILLTVAIADVSTYVRFESALDTEAKERGTSVYLPDRVIPMLPPALSNDACSLMPAMDRLAHAARIVFTRNGDVDEVRIVRAVIRNAARLTYSEVVRLLVDRDPEVTTRHAALVPILERMQELCLSLMDRRGERGAIDFDLPESEILLTASGLPEKIVRAERTIAHRMIEEFMLAANEAVARHLTERGTPMLYRVHEPPSAESVRDLAFFIKGLGLRLAASGARPTPLAYRRVLAAVAGRPEERLVNRVLLRSLTQARYAAENLGHFGLAMACYTHFTSPIRRYPDLVIHRLLGTAGAAPLTAVERRRLEEALPAIAQWASRRERIAMDAEREAVALQKVYFMLDKIGEIYSGFVTDVKSFGFFVELDNLFVEGLVHVRTLTDDFYDYDERGRTLRGRRSHRTIRIGDNVVVQLTAASIERRRLDFALARPVS